MRRQFATSVRENCSHPLLRVSSVDMLTKLLRMGIIGLMLCATNAWAGPASIQGIVKDAQGKPIKGADVQDRVARWQATLQYGKDRRQGSLHFTGSETRRLPGCAGSEWRRESCPLEHEYQVRSGNATELRSETGGGGASKRQQKKGKHMVWIPSSTGSHMGGRWVEVDDERPTNAGALNVKRASAEATTSKNN